MEQEEAVKMFMDELSEVLEEMEDVVFQPPVESITRKSQEEARSWWMQCWSTGWAGMQSWW